MVVLKGEMFRGLYRLVGNVQIDGAAGTATTSDSSRRQVARRKRVTFASSTKGYDDRTGSSQVKPLVLIFIKVKIVDNDKYQRKE